MPTQFQIKQAELQRKVLDAVTEFERETGLTVVEIHPQIIKHEVRSADRVKILLSIEGDSDK